MRTFARACILHHQPDRDETMMPGYTIDDVCSIISFVLLFLFRLRTAKSIYAENE